jgi:hypothetical protein
MTLTTREAEIFDALTGFLKNHKRAPSHVELGVLTGISSKATVNKYLKRFEDGGLIKRSFIQTPIIDLMK